MIVTLIIFNVILISSVWLYCKLSCGKCKCSRHLVGKTVIVTGANTGIGFETAKNLADRGACVILGCRNVERGIDARNKIVATTGNNDVHFKQLDLTSLSSVREFAKSVIQTQKCLDILINNAGIFNSNLIITKDGLLETMQVNHFGPFLLTSLLLPLLRKSAPSRIINVSSEAHHHARLDINDLNMNKASEKIKKKTLICYGNSKLCNILVTRELARRLEGTGVTCNALHPGVVRTDIMHQIDVPIFKHALPIIKSFFKSPWEGAQTSIYLAVSPDVADINGSYFRDCHIGKVSKAGQDSSLAENVWKISEEVVGIKIMETCM